VQVGERKATVRDEEAVGQEERARARGEQPHRELACTRDPFVREVRVQKIG
jgi:hypothetical protein